ncbi:MAG: DUF4386 family protein [Candidatus Hodarchaeales archaeon]|jgi:hypothetical protein
MSIDIISIASGFLFLFILILYLVLLPVLGYVIGMGNYDADSKLKKIKVNPKKFQLSILLALLHDVSVMILALLLFIAFFSYNILFGFVWIVFRTGEGLTLIYNEKLYWSLLNIAKQYTNARDEEKIQFLDLGNGILKKRNSNFSFGMIFWSVGTLA